MAEIPNNNGKNISVTISVDQNDELRVESIYSKTDPAAAIYVERRSLNPPRGVVEGRYEGVLVEYLPKIKDAIENFKRTYQSSRDSKGVADPVKYAAAMNKHFVLPNFEAVKDSARHLDTTLANIKIDTSMIDYWDRLVDNRGEKDYLRSRYDAELKAAGIKEGLDSKEGRNLAIIKLNRVSHYIIDESLKRVEQLEGKYHAIGYNELRRTLGHSWTDVPMTVLKYGDPFGIRTVFGDGKLSAEDQEELQWLRDTVKEEGWACLSHTGIRASQWNHNFVTMNAAYFGGRAGTWAIGRTHAGLEAVGLRFGSLARAAGTYPTLGGGTRFLMGAGNFATDAALIMTPSFGSVPNPIHHFVHTSTFLPYNTMMSPIGYVGDKVGINLDTKEYFNFEKNGIYGGLTKSEMRPGLQNRYGGLTDKGVKVNDSFTRYYNQLGKNFSPYDIEDMSQDKIDHVLEGAANGFNWVGSLFTDQEFKTAAEQRNELRGDLVPILQKNQMYVVFSVGDVIEFTPSGPGLKENFAKVYDTANADYETYVRIRERTKTVPDRVATQIIGRTDIRKLGYELLTQPQFVAPVLPTQINNGTIPSSNEVIK